MATKKTKTEETQIAFDKEQLRLIEKIRSSTMALGMHTSLLATYETEVARLKALIVETEADLAEANRNLFASLKPQIAPET